MRSIAALALTFAVVSAAAQEKAVIGRQAVVQYAAPWRLSDAKYRDATELVVLSPKRDYQLARVLMTVEPRIDFKDAVLRLEEIAGSAKEPARVLAIGGWPAIERVFTRPLRRRGQERKREPLAPAAMQQNAVVACAVDNSVVRFDISLAPGAPDELLQSALQIAHSAAFLSAATPPDLGSILKRLQDAVATQQKRGAPAPPASGGAALRGTAGGAVRVLGGFGELEVAASADSVNVVIAGNSGLSFSTNRGNSFSGGSSPFGMSDPSVARAASGNFYLAVIAEPTGTASQLGVNGCTNAVSRSTNNGANFNLRGYSANCSRTGTICFPDQEHIAADAFNSASGNDQLYAVWRNFTPANGETSCDQMGGGFLTSMISCSSDGGATWTTATPIPGGADFPRVAVGRDGAVYVVTYDGSVVQLNRFSSCSTMLTPAAGFPRLVATLSADVACPMPGLDRCNDGNTLSSPTVAPDPRDANHLFVTFAESDGASGERVVVAESFSRGDDLFPGRATISGSTSARRFMPWSCTARGTAWAGWYDRTAAAMGGSNDRTDYFLGGLRGPTWNLTNNPDPQCASGWPCQVRNPLDSDNCSVQPQLAGVCLTPAGGGSGRRCDFNMGSCPSGESCMGDGGCPKYGDYNGIACAGDYVYAAWASGTPPNSGGSGALNVYAARTFVGLDGAPIWRYTNVPCSGDNCTGWSRLDNNAATVTIAAAGGRLYQLHNNGSIWRSTGAQCEDPGWCRGWEQLDQNSSSVAIAASDSQFCQLHADGSIWRFTGSPCSGGHCTSWQQLDNNSATIAIVATGGDLYQLHSGGTIWRYTGTPCGASGCTGWQMLDNNNGTTSIAASNGQLYQLHADGSIWRYTGTPCSGDRCTSWQPLDRNAKSVAIVAGGNELYQLQNDGWIWRYTGTACSATACTGWQRLDNNSQTTQLSAAGGRLFQLHSNGSIWRYTGSPCSGDTCASWQRIDNNARTGFIAAADDLYQLHTDPLYQLHNDGSIWRYAGTECLNGACAGWAQLDNNPGADEIVAAGGQLFQRHADGSIWRSTGAGCNGTSCPGWQMADNNPATIAIAAGGTQLYQLHRDGSIWRHTGTLCSGGSCPGWQRLDNNPGTVAIAAAGSQFFQLHRDHSIWRYTGTPCSGDSCRGWQQIDNNPATASIVAAASNQLFQLHSDGSIWRFTGSSWVMLDNNPRTVQVAAARTQLYQRHSDGRIWRWTGTSWQLLDNNVGTVQIVAGGDHLYQRHSDGSLWRYTGAPCESESCRGWQKLDENSRTTNIAAGGFD